MPAAGGPGAPIAVTTQSSCSWTASTDDAWITIASGASGTGNGTVTYSAAGNPGAARTGAIAVAGQRFTLTQAACSFGVNSSSLSFNAGGGSGSATVTTTNGCAWTATSNDLWITVNSGSSGNGNGTVNFTVAANLLLQPRTGSLTIAGQTLTVTQAALVCSYQINPSSHTFTQDGGTGSVSVTAPAVCAWTAVSNDSWITVTSGGAGLGNGTVAFSAAPNNKNRSGTITIASQTFTVDESSK
jgi:hypothetical protein